MLVLREAESLLEILETFNKMYHDRSPVVILENIKNGKKKIFNFIIHTIDYANGLITFFNLDTENIPINLNNAKQIFIRGSEKSILFKQNNYNIKNKFVTIHIPNKVKMLEKRTNARIKFGFNSNHYAIIYRDSASNAKLRKSFTLRTFDLSQAGISLCFSRKLLSYFTINKYIFIKQLGDTVFPKAIIGNIVYIKKVEYMKHGQRRAKVKMGIALKEEFPYQINNIIGKK